MMIKVQDNVFINWEKVVLINELPGNRDHSHCLTVGTASVYVDKKYSKNISNALGAMTK